MLPVSMLAKRKGPLRSTEKLNLFQVINKKTVKMLNRFGFERHFATTTLFILNLAAVDLTYCLLSLPAQAVQKLTRSFPFGDVPTQILAIFSTINGYVSWMSVALVALSRCLFILNFWNNLSTGCSLGWTIGVIFGLLWVYGFSILVPILFGVI